MKTSSLKTALLFIALHLVSNGCTTLKNAPPIEETTIDDLYTGIIVLAGLIILFLSFFIHYIICDHVASTSVNYDISPYKCSGCGSFTFPESNLTIIRNWSWLIDEDYLNYLLPTAERRMEILLCENCVKENEARVKNASSFSGSLFLTFFLSGMIFSFMLTSITSFGILLMMFLFVYTPFYFAISMFLSDAITKMIPKYKPLAYFTNLGILRFLNKEYQKEFDQLNPNPKSYIFPQKRKSIFFYATTAFLILTLIPGILNSLIRVQPKAFFFLGLLIILAKAFTIVAIYNQKKYGFILWLLIVVANNVILYPDMDFEEIYFAMLVTPLFFYEWWKGRFN